MPSTGGRSACEPVAMIACLKLTSSPPSTAIVFASLKLPRPVTTSMPFALTTPVMPLTRPPTIVSLFFWVVAKSSSTPDTLTPSCANVSLASFNACAVCTQVLVGMQPTVMQVPPTRACSIMTTCAPSWAARMAAGYPPGPPPRTTTSHSIGLHSSIGRSTCEGIVSQAKRPARKHGLACYARATTGHDLAPVCRQPEVGV